MNHLSEDELIEVYYGEGTSASNTHLRACRQCAAQYAEQKQRLDAMQFAPVPQRSAEYGERVWETLRPKLISYEKKTAWHGWARWKTAALALACAMLLATVFLGGRYWERVTTKTAKVTTSNPQATQRVVLVVMGDHLDRTERLLVGLEHADSQDSIDSTQLQSEARQLLASNRLYRVTASNAGDPALAGALDRLERVLAEIANDPSLTPADLQRVREDMNTKGILFEIRVLRARSSDQVSGPEASKGASI